MNLRGFSRKHRVLSTASRSVSSKRNIFAKNSEFSRLHALSDEFQAANFPKNNVVGKSELILTLSKVLY